MGVALNPIGGMSESRRVKAAPFHGADAAAAAAAVRLTLSLSGTAPTTALLYTASFSVPTISFLFVLLCMYHILRLPGSIHWRSLERHFMLASL